MNNNNRLYTLLSIFVISCAGVLFLTVWGYSNFPSLKNFWEALYYYVAFATLAAPFAIYYMYTLTRDKLVWLYLIFPLFCMAVGVLFAGID